MRRRIWCTYVQLIARHSPMAPANEYSMRGDLSKIVASTTHTHTHNWNWWDGGRAHRIVTNMQRIRSKFISIVSISCPHRINMKTVSVSGAYRSQALPGTLQSEKFSCEKWLPSSSSSSSFRWIDCNCHVYLPVISCQSLFTAPQFCISHTHTDENMRACVLLIVRWKISISKLYICVARENEKNERSKTTTIANEMNKKKIYSISVHS